jgi:cation/acetate symporter
MLSKFALLLVALFAAYVAAQRPADILYLVAASFSLAGAAFVPAMIGGIFWVGATRVGAVCGMLSGLGLTLYYMFINGAPVRGWLGLQGSGLWFEIEPVASGVFGVCAGVMVLVVVSLLTPTRKPASGPVAESFSLGL